jgi:hypothetical protein
MTNRKGKNTERKTSPNHRNKKAAFVMQYGSIKHQQAYVDWQEGRGPKPNLDDAPTHPHDHEALVDKTGRFACPSKFRMSDFTSDPNISRLDAGRMFKVNIKTGVMTLNTKHPLFGFYELCSSESQVTCKCSKCKHEFPAEIDIEIGKCFKERKVEAMQVFLMTLAGIATVLAIREDKEDVHERWDHINGGWVYDQPEVYPPKALDDRMYFALVTWFKGLDGMNFIAPHDANTLWNSFVMKGTS